VSKQCGDFVSGLRDTNKWLLRLKVWPFIQVLFCNNYIYCSIPCLILTSDLLISAPSYSLCLRVSRTSEQPPVRGLYSLFRLLIHLGRHSWFIGNKFWFCSRSRTIMSRKHKRASCASSVQEIGPESSIASSQAPTPEPPLDRKSKFERRFDADSTSDEGVLGINYVSRLLLTLYWLFEQWSRWNHGGLMYMSISTPPSLYVKMMMSSTSSFAKSTWCGPSCTSGSYWVSMVFLFI
jgi:hypothetical protein